MTTLDPVSNTRHRHLSDHELHGRRPAKTGHRGCWRNFPSLSSANGSFSASNLESSLALPGHNQPDETKMPMVKVLLKAGIGCDEFSIRTNSGQSPSLCSAPMTLVLMDKIAAVLSINIITLEFPISKRKSKNLKNNNKKRYYR